jgi:hypothetical protein
MTRKGALKRWEANIANTENISQAIKHIVKSLIDRVGQRAPTALQGFSGLKFHPLEKANAFKDCSENQFTPHDLCDENHELRVEARL